MTAQTIVKKIEAEVAVQDVRATKKADKPATGSLPPQFNDAYMAAFLVNVRLVI